MIKKSYPIAKKVSHETIIHGDTMVDNYFWLRDMDRKNPEIIQYLEDENTYTDVEMKDTEELQEELFQELKGRVK